MASLDALVEAAKYVECKKEGSRDGDDAGGHSPMSDNRVLDGEPTMVGFRDCGFRRRPGGAGTRETHNKLEKFRRAHLKECFEKLRLHIPTLGSRKASNLSILKEALKYIEFLKEKDRKFEAQREKLMKCHKCLVERIKMFEEDMKRDGVQAVNIGPTLMPKDASVIVALKPENSQAANHTGVYVCVLTKRNNDSESEADSKELQYRSPEEHVDVVA